MEIKDIKTHLTMAEILTHYRLTPDPQHRLRCPFHDDRTASLQLYPKTDTAYCFSTNCPTHGKSMDVIDFVMNMEKLTKHEALKKAAFLIDNGKLPAGATYVR